MQLHGKSGALVKVRVNNKEFGSYSLNPILGFVLSIIVGIVLFIIGIVSWKLLIKYIHFVTDKRKKLYIEL